MLIKKAVQVRKHLERNCKDKDSKFHLILIESRIHRLARYSIRQNDSQASRQFEIRICHGFHHGGGVKYK